MLWYEASGRRRVETVRGAWGRVGLAVWDDKIAKEIRRQKRRNNDTITIPQRRIFGSRALGWPFGCLFRCACVCVSVQVGEDKTRVIRILILSKEGKRDGKRYPMQLAGKKRWKTIPPRGITIPYTEWAPSCVVSFRSWPYIYIYIYITPTGRSPAPPPLKLVLCACSHLWIWNLCRRFYF